MNKYDTEIELNKKSSLTYTISKIEPNSTVLEFGPATGYMTQYLKEQKGCCVSIVEIDREAYEIARNYAEDGICCDAEQLEWLKYFKDKKFDYITFSDVLEHLREPVRVLRASKDLLKENGKIITSIPNIAHNAVLIDLYNNKFQYRKTGILDNTHMRFFTYDSMKELFSECGLKVVDEDAVVFDLEYVGFGNTEGDVPENFWKEIEDREYGFVNQFLFTLSKNTDHEVEKYKDRRVLEAALYYTNDEKDKLFREENKIIAELVLEKGRFQVDFDLTGIEFSRVRIEPFERFCIVEEIEASIGSESVELRPQGGFEIRAEGRGFIADIPKYEATVENSGILHVCGVIKNIELSDIKLYLRQDSELRQQEKHTLETEINRLNQMVEEKLDIIQRLGVKINNINQEVVRLNSDCALMSQEIQCREEKIAEKDAKIEEILNGLPKWLRKKFV